MTLMSRQPWTPETATEAQLRLREAVNEAADRADAAEAELVSLVKQAHEAGVPMEDLAERSRRSRATLFRKLKPPRT